MTDMRGVKEGQDLAIIAFALGHLENIEAQVRAIQEAFRLVKEDGIVVLLESVGLLDRKAIAEHQVAGEVVVQPKASDIADLVFLRRTGDIREGRIRNLF